jgi:hypothetical protein
MPDGERERLEQRIAQHPELTLALAGPDAVYTLAPDPWMWRLAGDVPDGETVDLPLAGSDPAAFGMLIAILQREGLHVTGSGTIDYFTLRPALTPRCWAILPTGTDPAGSGYAGAALVRAESGMALYRRAGCAE